MARKPTSRLVEPHQLWLLAPDEAAAMVGGAQVLLDIRTAGWIAPLIERSQMTRYDVIDVGATRLKLRQLGDGKLQEQAALGAKTKK